jgi:hypothetical protein
MGNFRYRGRDFLEEHILPKQYEKYNIIHHYRDDFFNSSTSNIHLHKYFHHLNSSQALCINLFFPLLLDNELNLILDQIGIPHNTITRAYFEKESDLETGAGRKTNFDFYLQLADQTQVYFEIKYSEYEFGKAKSDDEHKNKFINTYQPLLKNNRFIKHEYNEMNIFLDSYQIMRNLVHINDTSFVVFVYPEANRKIHQQSQIAYNHMLTDKGKSKFRILLLEKTVDDILRRVHSNRLQNHFKEFKVKYLNYIIP